MPGVGHPQDLGDGALTVDHEAMHLPEHVADLGEVVLGVQPGPGEQAVVVGAALAVDERELDGRGGSELAEQVGDEHGGRGRGAGAEPPLGDADDHQGDEEPGPAMTCVVDTHISDRPYRPSRSSEPFLRIGLQRHFT
jgi:hypothetical protein